MAVSQVRQRTDCRISYLCMYGRICLAVKSDSLASPTTLLLVWQLRGFISLRYVDLLNEFKLQTICCGKSRNIESQTIDASTRDNLALISQRGQPASQPVNHIPLFDSLQSHVRNSSLMIRTKDSHKKGFFFLKHQKQFDVLPFVIAGHEFFT